MGVDEMCREYFLWCRFLYEDLACEENPAGKPVCSGTGALADASSCRQQCEGGTAIRPELRQPEKGILSL